MKKIIPLQDLDCAVCASKIERAISAIDGVRSANVSFLAQKITLDIADGKSDEVLSEIKVVCKKIEPDCKLIF